MKELRAGHGPVVETVEAGSGSATGFAVANLEYTSASANAYDGQWVYFPSVTAEPKCARITRGGFTAATGTFVIDPDLGSTPADGSSVYFLGSLHISEVIEAINNINRTLYLPRYGVLSLTSDPNMDDSGTDGYTAVTSASLSKVTTTGLVYSGTQALTVTGNGAAGSGVRTESLLETTAGTDSTQTSQFMVSVIFRITTGAWDFELVDGSANSIKKVSVTHAQGTARFLEVRFTDTAESGDTSVNVQITTPDAAANIIVVDSISLLSPDYPTVPLPSQIADAADIEGLFYFPQGQATAVDDVYVPFGNDPESYPSADYLRDYAAVNSQRLTLPDTSRPVWAKYLAKDTTLTQNTGDTNTTVAPEDMVVAGALADLHGRLSDRLSGTRDKTWHRGRAKDWARRFAAEKAKLGLDRPRIDLRSQYRVMAR